MSGLNFHPRHRALARRIGLFVVFAASQMAQAETPPVLGIDPFRERPEEAGLATTPNQPEEVEPFAAVLRSTVSGTARPLVNLGGEILTLGETAHGYRLLEVGTFEAVFEREGERIRLEVVPNQEGEDR